MTALPSAGGSSHCAADPAALRPFPPAADETPAQPHAAAEGRGGAGPPRVPLSLPARRRGRGGAPPLEGGRGETQDYTSQHARSGRGRARGRARSRAGRGGRGV